MYLGVEVSRFNRIKSLVSIEFYVHSSSDFTTFVKNEFRSNIERNQ